MTGQRAPVVRWPVPVHDHAMSTNATLLLVVSVLGLGATVVLVVGIRAAVEIVRVRAGADPHSPGRMKP